MYDVSACLTLYIQLWQMHRSGKQKEERKVFGVDRKVGGRSSLPSDTSQCGYGVKGTMWGGGGGGVNLEL